MRRLLIVLMAILVLLPSCGRQEEPPNSLPKEVKEHTSDGDYVDSAQAAELLEMFDDLLTSTVKFLNVKFDADRYGYKHLTDRQRKEITDYRTSVIRRLVNQPPVFESIAAKLEKGEKITYWEFEMGVICLDELQDIRDQMDEIAKSIPESYTK